MHSVGSTLQRVYEVDDFRTVEAVRDVPNNYYLTTLEGLFYFKIVIKYKIFCYF